MKTNEKTMKMIRARFARLEEFEVIKETEKQIVYINERGTETREAKVSDWSSWHKTTEEAINYLISRKQKEIDTYLSRIEYLKKEMNKIYELKITPSLKFNS